jgi:hypothetical protein
MKPSALLALAALALGTGCGRHVVLSPEAATAANDRAWTIRSEPGSAAATPAGASSSVRAPSSRTPSR